MNQSHRTQVERYGGEEGYRKEMARRRSLVKKPTGFALLDKAKLHEISVKGGHASKRGKPLPRGEDIPA